jgi:type II secretory pathway component GspD/PulD (secretin)
MRVRNWLVVGLVLTLATAGFAQSFRLIFSDTDVADVLRSISLRTGANIVYSSAEPLPISINVTVNGAEDAVRAAASAAGLGHRRVGNTFIVASVANMRKAMEPFGQRALIDTGDVPPAEMAKRLEEMYPWLTARVAGDQVLLIGASQDIADAQKAMPEIQRGWFMAQRVNEVVFLKYAGASQVVTMVKAMYPTLSADAIGVEGKPGGGIGLSGARGEVMAAKEIIRQVDVPLASMQPDVQYHVYQIRYSSAPELKMLVENANLDCTAVIGPLTFAPRMPRFNPLSGSSLGTSGPNNGGGIGGATGGGAQRSTQGATAGGTGAEGGSAGGDEAFTAGDESKLLVLRGTRESIDRALALIAQVDIEPIQVMVEVKVIDASPEKIQEYGIDWSWSPFSFLEAPAGTEIGSFPSNTRRPGFGEFSRVPWDFTGILTAMVTNKDAKILAKPRIQVIDNRDATIFIGDTVRARVSQAGGLGGQTVEIVEFPIGIVLLIRPRVNADGNITMRIHPIVSTITAIDAQNVPQTSSREADTTVMVKDGETMVIGGLIREEDIKTMSKIPLLGDLPLIGELFRSRSHNNRKSEVLVVITPRIVRGAGATTQPSTAGTGAVRGGN